MYKTIYVPVDNSDHSNAAIDLALAFGKAFRAALVGSHVYAAKLHDVRFKQMEFTLPDEYKDETELEKQRKIHDALIGRGLHLISDSYLDQMDSRARESDLPFTRKHFDGRNFEALVDDIRESVYDLVILGALGQGAVKDSRVGSVVERVLRRTEVDTLVVRQTGPAALRGGRIAVCFDGSPHSRAGLVTACRLAKAFDRKVEIVVAVEPPAGADQAEEAALLRAHLQIAESYARNQDLSVSSRLLEGSGREALTRFLGEDDSPWLLVVGRCGSDANGAAPIGSTTGHLVRHSPCNVLVSGGIAAPAALRA